MLAPGPRPRGPGLDGVDARPGPRTPASTCGGPTRSPAGSCSPCAPAGAPAAGARPRRPRRPRARPHGLLPRRRPPPGAHHRLRHRRGRWSRTSRGSRRRSGARSTCAPARGPRCCAARRPATTPTAYVVERHEFPSVDGTPVPATVMRHRDTPLDGTAPAVLYAYGAYGYTFEPEWDPALPSLLDRGVVYVARPRPRRQRGRAGVVPRRQARPPSSTRSTTMPRSPTASPPPAWSTRDRIASRGLSAGGLLQGAVFSQRPDRWRAVVAEVPFVDVVTTMFDEATPLTITEWDEWGDPRVREQFDWMLAYSPYDNLPPAGGRPDLLVTGAVHDPRVMVREPAKWVAALRASDPEWSPRCLFRCGGGGGRPRRSVRPVRPPRLRGRGRRLAARPAGSRRRTRGRTGDRASRTRPSRSPGR